MVDPLIDPLADEVEDPMARKIKAIRMLLVRQYGPGSMRKEVDAALNDAILDGLSCVAEDLIRDDEVHLDKMTVVIKRDDGEPFEPDELLDTLDSLMSALLPFTPQVDLIPV